MADEENKPRLYVIMTQEILCRKDISTTAKLLYARMSGFEEYFESCATAGELLGKSEETIKKAKQELEKKGLIECIKNTGRGKVYRVRLDKTYQSEGYKSTSQSGRKLPPYNKDEYKSYNKEHKEREKKENGYHIVKMEKPVSEHSLSLASLLKEKILENYPNNVGAKKTDCVNRWAKDIDKMIRIDNRNISDIEKAILWAMSDSFWQRNIWSGANLRKYYDRLEADARAKFMKNGQIVL